MNPLHTLPVTILPLAPEPEQEELLGRLTQYFQANPLAARVVRQPDRTQKLIEMAAHSRQMWSIKWVNPTNGKQLLVVADKSMFPDQSAVHTTLARPEMLEVLESWTK